MWLGGDPTGLEKHLGATRLPLWGPEHRVLLRMAGDYTHSCSERLQ